MEANQEPIIAHEILLSVDRLLKTSGNTLRFEWTVIITMLQRIAAVMNFSISPSASFVCQSPKARMVQATEASETQHEAQVKTVLLQVFPSRTALTKDCRGLGLITPGALIKTVSWPCHGQP